MRNRLVVLAAGLVFAISVAVVAVVGGGGGDTTLEKLPAAAADGDALSRDSASAASYPAFGPVQYQAKGPLPDLGGTAPAYRLGSTTTRADVARLAAIVGLAGEVREEPDLYVVSAGGRQLVVERQPGLRWYLSPACAELPVSSDGGQTAVCAQGGVVGVEPGSTGDPVGSGSAGGGSGSAGSTGLVEPDRVEPQPEPVRPAGLPTRAEAEDRARDLFAKLGAGVDDFQIVDAFSAWEASVQPRVGGLATIGWSSNLAIGPRGEVVWAAGVLAEPDRIGDYPLVGTEKGFERLKEGVGVGPRPLAMGGAEPVTAQDGNTDPDGTDIADCSKATVICDPPPGSPIPSEPPVQIVTGAHLALQQVDDRLVPVYVFQLENGDETFTVPAVVDELLEQPSDKGERGRPTPEPTDLIRPALPPATAGPTNGDEPTR